jgi:hypothetical protein
MLSTKRLKAAAVCPHLVVRSEPPSDASGRHPPAPMALHSSAHLALGPEHHFLELQEEGRQKGPIGGPATSRRREGLTDAAWRER